MKKNKNLLKGLLIAISIFIILFLLLASTFNIRTTSISRTISKMFLGTDTANVVETWNGFYDSTGKFYNITATLYDDGTFIFSGNGKMQEYDSERHCQWYSYSDSIKNVRIESGITNIGSYAFAYCSNLTSIEIASSVTTIGTKAFDNCSNLTSIEIPSSVTTIGTRAFAECSSLRSINIPSNVKSIGDHAFQNCSSLMNAKIPSTVTSIGDDVFEGCKSLEEIIVDESNKTYISLDGVLFNKNKTKIIKYPSSKRGEIYEIPSTVTSIEDSAFENCTNLRKVIIPSTVTSIGYYAFYGCSNLTSINIPKGITSIESSTFENCTSLTNIEIPSTVKRIGYSAFESCTSLENIKLPDTMTSIGTSAFENCENLTNIEMPNVLTTIESSAFKGCSSLESIEIPEGVKSLGYWVFEDCSNLTSITIPSSITSINDTAFDGCENIEEIIIDENNTIYSSEDGVLFNKDKTELIKCPVSKETYIIPSSVKTIKSDAFERCILLTSVKIPDSVTSIGTSAFYECNSLKSIKIPSGVTTINNLTFAECSSLSTVEISNGVTNIGQNAFRNCISLTSIEIPASVTTIVAAFNGCEKIEKIVVNGNNTNYTSVDGVLFSKDKTELVRYPEGKKGEKYEISSTVTTIDGSAFRNCINLISIEIPDSVTTINYGAFNNCTNLSNVTVKCNSYARSYMEENYDYVLNIEHITSIYVSTIPPTCTEQGYTTYTCTCGENFKTDIIEAIGHSIKNYVSNKDATCTEDGTKTAICDNGCGTKDTRIDEGSAGHKYSEEWTIDIEATCIEKGSKSYHCTRCEVKTEITEVPELGHNYEEKITLPTCTEQGYTTHTCTRCSDSYVDKYVDELGHTEVVDEAKAPTCTETGLTEGKHCSVCNEVLKAQEIVPELGHDYEDKVTLPTCTEKGYTTHTCTRCSDSYVDKYVDELGHTEVVDEAKAPTCTETGLTEGKHCSVCNEVLKAQEIVPELGHDYKEEITAPTCTQKGYTTHTCTRCSDSYVDKYVDELGHTEVVDEAKVPTCTETGLTEGKHCSVCNEVLKAQEIVPELGHDYKEEITAPTCTEQGYTTHTCTRCSDSYIDTYVDALGHTEVIDRAVAATCTETGLTEGKHCSVCKEVLVAQNVVPVNGHTEVIDRAVEATCTETGLTEGKHCSVCNEVLVKQEVVEALGHTEVIDRAVEATCTETGLTEGKHCSVCNEVLKAQEIVPELGHDYKEEITAPTCTQKGYTTHTCTRCSDSYVDKYVDELGHTEVVDEAKAPTCTETGLTEGKHCSVCKEVLVKQEEVPVLGHDKQEHEGKAATCTEKGWKAYVICSRCDYTTYEEIEKLGHDYSEEWTIDVEATCTEVGSKSHHCTRCEEKTEIIEIPAKGHTEVKDEAVSPTCTETGLTEGKHCSVCNEVLKAQEIVPELGHDYEDKVTLPTCTEQGYTTHTCTRCSDSYVDKYVDELGHTEVVDEAKVPTCTETGLTEGKHCSVCNEVLKAQEIVPELGHDYKEEITAPTCTEQGYTTHTCTRCSDSYIDTYVDALGHTEVIDRAVEATCTETGLTEGKHCSVCKEVLVKQEEVPVLGHDKQEHEGKAATCTEKGWKAYVTCSRCDYTTYEEIEKLGHDYSEEWTIDVEATCTEVGSKSHHCTRCEEKTEIIEIPAKGHTEVKDEAVSPTCTETGLTEGKHCSVCNEVVAKQEVVEALGHTEAKDEAVSPTCTETGLTEGKHCSVCNEVLTAQEVVNALGHDYEEEIIAPTCTEKGYTTHTCTRCSENYVDTYVNEIGHNIGEWVIEKEATTTEEGLKYRVCTNCGSEREEEIIPIKPVAEWEIAGEEGTNIKVNVYEDGTLKIEGEGELPEYTEETVPWKEKQEEITKVEIGEGITNIGKDTFDGCTNLEEIIVDKDNPNYSSKDGVLFDKDGSELIKYPEGKKDESYEVPEGVTTIGKEAFEGNEYITSITIPKEVENIGENAFDGCTNLEEIIVDENNPNYSSKDGVLFDKDGTELIKYPEGKKDETYEIPEIVTTIRKEAFEGNNHVTEVTMPENVENIGENAFNGCEKLTTIKVKCTTYAESHIKENYNYEVKVEHEYSEEWTIDKETTCTEVGSKSHYCTRCEDKTDITEIPALGHDYKEEITDPTCTEEGYTTHTCARCSDSYIDTYVDVLGHKEVVDSAVAATCTETGLTEGKHCSVCNEVLAAQEVVNALGHDYEDKVTLPTCTEKGYTTHTCTRCSDSYVDTYVDALGHTEVIDEAKEPICTETGLTEGKHCAVCKEVLVAQEEVPALGHDKQEHERKEATCEEKGWKAYETCSRCNYTTYEEIPELGHDYKEEITDPTCTEKGYTTHTCARCSDSYIDTYVDALGHKEVVDSAVAATCTETGLTEGKHCSVCKEVLVAQNVVPVNGHTEVIDEAVSPICTETGLTEGKHCAVCNEVLVKQEVVEALGHTEVIDRAVAATCTETGLTEGKHCSVCNEVLVAQNVVPVNGHTEVIDEAVSPICTETGLTEGKHCSVCNEVLVKQEVVEALGHTEVIDHAVAATCTETGLTEGKHCSVCNEVLKAQEIVPELGHDYKEEITAPTCTEQGYTTHTCTRCSDSYIDTYVDALGHTEVIDRAVEATCTETGLTEGKHCSVCKEVLVKQEEVPVLGHDKQEHEGKAATCTEKGWKAYVTCSRCDYTTYEEIEKLGHDYSEEWTIDVEATCTEVGSKSHHCTRCEEKTEIIEIPAKGHTEVKDEAVSPTCTETGLTEGKHCSVCNEVLKAQEIVPELGHDYEDKVTLPTCTEQGYTTHTCTRCSDSYVDKYVDELGHTEVVDEAKVPTCTETGLTEGKHCSACKKEIVAQKLIAATGHYMGEWIIDREPTQEEEGHKYRVCINCNVEREDEDIPKLVNTEVEIITTYMVKEHNNEKFLIMDKVEQVDKVLNNITSDKELTIIDRNGNKLDQNEKAGTGSKVIIKESEKAVYTISLKGDVNGDAEVTPVDVTMSNSIRLRKIEFNMENLFAADINGNGKVEPIEITIINSIRLGKVRI